ncbi:hypothetical protein IT409_00035 [Candidatus Falkowbacteria bacterium]|nr:hypothetical protein [Candidatus Falkowbacteria bacterium]
MSAPLQQFINEDDYKGVQEDEDPFLDEFISGSAGAFAHTSNDLVGLFGKQRKIIKFDSTFDIFHSGKKILVNGQDLTSQLKTAYDLKREEIDRRARFTQVRSKGTSNAEDADFAGKEAEFVAKSLFFGNPMLAQISFPYMKMALPSNYDELYSGADMVGEIQRNDAPPVRIVVDVKSSETGFKSAVTEIQKGFAPDVFEGLMGMQTQSGEILIRPDNVLFVSFYIPREATQKMFELLRLTKNIKIIPANEFKKILGDAVKNILDVLSDHGNYILAKRKELPEHKEQLKNTLGNIITAIEYFRGIQRTVQRIK